MANATIQLDSRFPDGASVSAYLSSTQSLAQDGPSGNAVATATVADQAVTFTGLTEDEAYLAYANVSGVWQKQGFVVNTLPPGAILNGVEIATQAALEEEAALRSAADSALEDLIDGIGAGGGVDWYNVMDYGAVADGATDDLAAFTAAHAACVAAGGGVVYAPAGSYLLDGEFRIDQYVCLRGAGSRETKLYLNDTDSVVRFNKYLGGSPVNSRGGMCGGFMVDGQNLSTLCMDVQVAVNRKFVDIRVQNIGTDGIGLRLLSTQNCTFVGIETDEGGGATTTGIKVTESASGNQFNGVQTNEHKTCHIHITQDTAGGQNGIGQTEPRNNSFHDLMVERGDPANGGNLVLIESGRDNEFYRNSFALGVGDTVSSDYNMVEINQNGQGNTRTNKFYGGYFQGNTSPAKHAIGFNLSDAGCHTTIRDIVFGNVSVGIAEADGHGAVVENCMTFGSANTFSTGAINQDSFASANSITANKNVPHYPVYNITGTTTINSLGVTAPGHIVVLRFAGSLTVSSSAGNIKLSGGVDMSATADDNLTLLCDGTNWNELARCVK